MAPGKIAHVVIMLLLLLSWGAGETVHTQEPAEVGKGIYSEIIGRLRIQVLSDTLVRLEVRGPKGFEDRTTFHIVNRTDWPGAEVHRVETEDAVLLELKTAVVVVKKNATSLEDVHITDKHGVRIWEFTGLPGNKVALPRANEPVLSFAIADTPRVVPSPWGFNPQPEWNTEHRETNGWDFSNDAPDMYVFLPNNDHRQLRRDFVNLTGKPELVPLSALGAWDSRYYVYSEETALAQIDGYHSRNLPLDVLVVDTDWRASSTGMGYTVNTKLFPDLARFFQRAHERNVLVIFNDHPEPTRTGTTENHVLAPDEVRYRSENLKRFLELGLDAWWYDRNWVRTVIPPAGLTHEVMGMAVYADAFQTVYPNRRLLMLSNVDGIWNGVPTGPSNIATHRYSVQWTGDTSGGQETILQEVKNTLEKGETAALGYVSTDLGAHTTLSTQISDREYIRWIQAGALLPIFRLHVTKGDTGRMPWLRGETVTNIYREYLNLRYRLLPVFYQLAYEHYETGMPIARAMTFYAPEYAGADRYDQYMLGDHILVAPIIENTVPTPVPADWLSVDGVSGLRAEYFNNKFLTGTPVVTRIEEHVNFKWGQGRPYPQVNADHFSVRYTGTITNRSAHDITLGVISDDGARLYIDGQLVIDEWIPKTASAVFAPVVLEAGKSYQLRLEYFEETGEATLILGYVVGTPQTSKERTVFIPEGEWINTVTGETVYGPQTITVQCEIEQMPIFIRKGAAIPLADETLTVKDSDWSHLTLDVYPSTRYAAETILYEDDTETNDYKKGLFRTTTLRTGFRDGKAILEIGPAEGTFFGPRAFAERDWTVRVHRPEGWGELVSVTVNGQELPFEKIPRDPHALPLNNKGGATDGDVYVVRHHAPVDEAQVFEFAFAHPIDPPVPAGNYEAPRLQLLVAGHDGVSASTGRTPTLKGEVSLWVRSGYKAPEVVKVLLTAVPVRNGERQEQDTVTLYAGGGLPESIVFDSRRLEDGTYDLHLTVQATLGRESKAERRVIVRNWSVMHDPFLPPASQGWFGTVERKLTIAESPGWDYATDNAELFFGDANRRVWLGDGVGHLIWEAPDVQRFLISAYVRVSDLSALEISVSADKAVWYPVTWQYETVDATPAGWHKVEVRGVVEAPVSARYIRLSAGDALRPDVFQLGEVRLWLPEGSGSH